MLVVVRIRRGRRSPQTCCSADKVLINQPQTRLTQERLVVKTRRQKPAENTEHSPEIDTEGWPTVLATRHKPFINIEICRPGIGFKPSADPHLHEGVGLLHPRRHHPPRSVIFEAPPKQHHPMRQQRRGQTIPRMTRIGLAVEGETHGLRPVYDPACGQPHAAHDPSPRSSTAAISWVTECL